MRKAVDPEKLRDMIRSILPSTKRRQARKAKAIAKRQVRRGVREDLRCRRGFDDIDNLFREPKLDGIVHSRRAYDKLNPFMRWCRSMTRGLPIKEALARVRAILPRDIIGDHAYTHWEIEASPGFDRLAWLRDIEREKQSDFDKLRFRFRRAYADDPTLAGALNRMIKARIPFDQPRRLLRGVHDMDDFVREVMEHPGCRKIERRCLKEIIEHIEKGGLAAALQCVYGMFARAIVFASVPRPPLNGNAMRKLPPAIAARSL